MRELRDMTDGEEYSYDDVYAASDMVYSFDNGDRIMCRTGDYVVEFELSSLNTHGHNYTAIHLFVMGE